MSRRVVVLVGLRRSRSSRAPRLRAGRHSVRSLRRSARASRWCSGASRPSRRSACWPPTSCACASRPRSSSVGTIPTRSSRSDFGDPRAAFEIGSDSSVVTTRGAPRHGEARALPRRVRDRVRRVAGRGRRRARHGVRGRARQACGSACATTSTSTASARRRAGSTSAAGKLGGYSFTMWNTDTYGYDADTDPIYASVPFFMVLRNGRAHGIFFDNTLPQHVRHRARVAGPALLRRRRRRARLLLHRRARRRKRRGRALHRADRPHAAAAALGARLQPVPLQLLPGVEGPLHRRQLPRSAGSRPT